MNSDSLGWEGIQNTYDQSIGNYMKWCLKKDIKPELNLKLLSAVSQLSVFGYVVSKFYKTLDWNPYTGLSYEYLGFTPFFWDTSYSALFSRIQAFKDSKAIEMLLS